MQRWAVGTRGSRLVLLALGAGAAGCNLITGSSDLHVATGGAASNAAGTGGASVAGAGGAATGNAATTQAAATNGPGSPASSSSGPACGGACGANQHCESSTMTCVCDPGFMSQGASCVAVPPGDPSTRTQADMCARWKAGHVVTTPMPFTPGPGGQCDPGTLSQGGITDTLTRLNMFRWLSGLGPVSDDATLDQTDQACAVLESWWDFASGGSPHMPPSTAKCYTQAGASGAGMSNIAWGNGPADSIDQFIQDQGNETTLGHRRWCVYPPLGPVGIGYWQGGGTYGSAECLAVFHAQGGGPTPSFVAVPNQGFTELTVASWVWSFHAPGATNAQIAVLRVDDNAPLAVKLQALPQGYGDDAISWTPQGWTAQAGKTYRVTVSGLAGGNVTYDVKPVTCP